MQNIILLSDSADYTYHLELCTLLQALPCFKSFTIHHLDINKVTAKHLYFNQIQELSPAIIITLDLAGFQFYTQLGRISFNILHTKILNLIWGNKEEYAPYLSQPLSLSMHFFDCSENPYDITKDYPNVEYYNSLGTISTITPLCKENEEILSKIAACFLSEVGI